MRVYVILNKSNIIVGKVNASGPIEALGIYFNGLMISGYKVKEFKKEK